MPDYYSGWESEVFHCLKCEWTGTGVESDQGEMFSELFELDCPNCGKKLTVITYPTIEENRANWDKVSAADKQMIEACEQFIKEAEAESLKQPEELPEVEGGNLVFVWDFIWGDYLTIIRFGDKVIWREPAFYEGYTRFREVAIILKEKYGERLKDIAPAQRSYNALLGDSFSADETIQNVRDWIRQGNLRDLPPEKIKLQTLEKRRNNNEVKSDSNKTTFGDAHSTQSLSNLPRLHTTKQLPEINSDDDLVLVWDEIESEKSPQIVIRYGNIIIWKEYSYFGCSHRFEPIAIILQQKYGNKLKDLIPTRLSEINLYGDRSDGKGIVSVVQGNIWMNRYALNSENVTNQTAKVNSNNSKPIKETKLEYKVHLEEEFWLWDEPELLTGGNIIYETYEEALIECKRIIDNFLIENHKPTMRANELYSNYLKFGDEPYIVPKNESSSFSALGYAKQRCAEICE